MKNLALVWGMTSLLTQSVPAAISYYTGPEYGNPTSSVLGGGRLDLASNTGPFLTGSFQMGNSPFSSGASLVFYIDSVAGGYENMSAFIGTPGNAWQDAISGYRPPSSIPPSLATFAGGFAADYAIVLRPTDNRGYLFQLSTGGIDQVASVGQFYGGTKLDFSVEWSLIGIGPGDNRSIKFESTYLSDQGTRYAQSLETFSITGGNITFTDYDVFPDVPEPVNVALGLFAGIAGVAGLFCRFRKARLGTLPPGSGRSLA